MSSFPEYGRAHLSEDCRAHFLGAASCWNAAHEALLRDDKRAAFDEMEKCLILTIEARKLLIAQGVPKPPEPIAEVIAPLQCKHGTDLDIVCVECVQEAEKTNESVINQGRDVTSELRPALEKMEEDRAANIQPPKHVRLIPTR